MNQTIPLIFFIKDLENNCFDVSHFQRIRKSVCKIIFFQLLKHAFFSFLFLEKKKSRKLENLLQVNTNNF